MTAFSRLASVTFVLALAVAGGIVLYRGNEIGTVQADVTRAAGDVAQAYREIAERTVFPSENSLDLTQDQRRTAGHVRTAYSSLSDDKPLPETVANITALQVALIAYLRQSLASDALRASPETLALQQELGRDGSVRVLLDAYNTNVKAWNDVQATPLGALRAQMLGEDREMLPYLRFDGQQEYVNVVEL